MLKSKKWFDMRYNIRTIIAIQEQESYFYYMVQVHSKKIITTVT